MSSPAHGDREDAQDFWSGLACQPRRLPRARLYTRGRAGRGATEERTSAHFGCIAPCSASSAVFALAGCMAPQPRPI